MSWLGRLVAAPIRLANVPLRALEKIATVEDAMREGRRIATEVEDWRGKP